MKSYQLLHDKWTVDSAEKLYRISDWGAGYFHISPEGNVTVTPDGSPTGPSASLIDIIEGVKERGLSAPILLRFEQILHSRVSTLYKHFKEAIRDYGYKGDYRGVYPVKVNQQEQVIEELVNCGREFHHGLEAGSKAELLLAMSYLDDPDAYLVCNGYKDEEFIDLGLSARKLGINCIFVIEAATELPIVIKRSKALGIDPVIGVRVKLTTRGSGHWKDSGGDRSVFGLNSVQIIQLCDTLREEGMLHCLQLLHFHLGSQIPNVRDIRTGVAEATRFYCELVKEGAPMGLLDLGGGLAIDYDGSNTNFSSSCNYSIGEYCRDVVEILQTSFDAEEIPHPHIITESGRATVAYYSVLLFNILDVMRFKVRKDLPEVPEDFSPNARNIRDTAKNVSSKNILECFHDAIYYRDEVRELFRHGNVSLRERALVEEIFWIIMDRIAAAKQTLSHVPEDIENLEDALADIYYGNLSVFQSLPDAWAIGQLFPVMPIHKLKEEPTRYGIIADITCDCDGKIDHFIDLHDVQNCLPLHEIDPATEDYYIGAFLVGAYQETLGDLHNLMGDTNVVSVRIDDEGIHYMREIEGDSVQDVLTYVEYDVKELQKRFRTKAEKAVRENRISGSERRRITDLFNEGIRGYTYYETN